MRRCLQSRVIMESLEASGIESVSVTHHLERIETPEKIVVDYKPLPIPPTMHYKRRGRWYEVIGMPKEIKRPG